MNYLLYHLNFHRNKKTIIVSELDIPKKTETKEWFRSPYDALRYQEDCLQSKLNELNKDEEIQKKYKRNKGNV